MVIEGTAYWAFIKEPNVKFAPKYTIDVVVDDEKAQDLKDQGYSIMDKGNGPVVIIKRNVNGPDGMIRSAPMLMDAKKEPLDVKVGNGSKVKVQAKPWESTYNGQHFKGLDLQKVQVLKLVEYVAPPTENDELIVESVDEEELDEL